MKNKRFFSLLSAFLATVMLLGALPLGVFAYEMPKGNSTPNYTDFRGKFGMSADENGVMIYDELEGYYKTSHKDVKLSTEYKTVDDSKSASNTSVVAYYDECPYLYADYAIYFDESIEGTTYKVRYGLSMEDGVYYTDPATREIVKGNVSPIELTASNSNTQNPDYNAGYTMVKGENDELLYTTRHQNDKAIIFYIINHRASDRIGTEDDISILSDYIAQGYVVITVDFKSHEQAVTPFIENALVPLRAMFDKYTEDDALKSLSLVTNTNNIFFLPEGCRIERDVWFWDPSIYGVIGTMERFRQNWNEKISSEAAVNASDPTKYDTLNIGSVDSVEELISTVTKKDGTPIEYKQTMDIIYPSQPKDGYEAPLYIQEATLQSREQNVLQGYTRIAFTSMALNGYACAQYDHAFWPFLYRDEYKFADSGSHYGLSNSSAHMARAAVRCARSLADELGYSSVYAGAAGISKATVGIAILSIKNNKQIPQSAVKAFGVTYSNIAYEGDIYKEGVADKDKGKIPSGATYDPNCELAIVQPFMYYDAACTEEISSDCTVAYNSSGGGVQQLFGEYAKYEKVPMVLSCGTRDDYRCYDYWEEEVAWFDAAALNSFLPMVQLDQGHTYPVGYDNEHGYYRTNAMLKFFDIYLKPDAQRAPEVLWVTPLNGANGVPVSGKWQIGPYTPFKWEVDSYYYDQSIQIRFVDSVDPASVNTGVKVTDASGRVVDGTWVASQKNALYTFECDTLEPATAYTIHITRDVKGENGVALAESREVSFTTEGTYLVDSAADTYVSAYAPDKAFGDADVLKIREGYTTLVSFATENVIDAEEVLLYADVANDANPTAEVYALANTLVDGNLTYAGLTALDAWTNKTLLGTYTVEGDLLAFDFTALTDMELGEYVTLAFVSADEPTDTFKYYNGFDDFDFTNPVTKEVDGTTYTVIAKNGQLTDGRSAGGKEWNVNTPSSPYVWCRTGPTSEAYIRTVDQLTAAGVPSDSQAFRATTTKSGTSQIMKFFNVTTDSLLTEADIGKIYRATFDIYTPVDTAIASGFSMTLQVGSNAPGKIYGEKVWTYIPAKTWTTVTMDLPMTAELVALQAGLLSIELQYPAADSAYYTYFDNLRVEELTPALEAERGAFSLVTTNKGIALNSDITVTLDAATELATFAESATVRNESTGKQVKGEWVAVGEDDKSFAFVTKGLEPATTYTVSVADEVIKTVFTEGDYALRPIATSYVSKSEPEKHFGLDKDVILNSDKLGVLTFSAKTLKNAKLATLYLDVDTARNTYFTVYALTDFTPDSSLCYNTLASKLTSDSVFDSFNVVDGKLALDLSSLVGREFGDAVTFVIKAGYTFFNDFESPVLTSAKSITAGQLALVPSNVSFSDTYIWNSMGATSAAYQMTKSGSDSQTFHVTTYDPNGPQRTKFYNTLKSGELLNVGDVGRTYTVSFKIRATHNQTQYNVGNAEATTITVPVGYTHRDGSGLKYNNKNYYAITMVDMDTPIPSLSLALGDTKWTTVNFDLAINEAMTTMQCGMLTLEIPTVGTHIKEGSTLISGAYIYTFYDDILVEEVITDEIGVGGLMLVTENSAAVEITDADKPVEDAVEGEEEILPNLDASLVSYQVTKGEDGVFSIRLIAGLDSLNYKYFGYEVTVTTAEGTKTLSGTDSRVYAAICAGETEYSVKENFGYEYAAFATVKDLALDTEAEIAVCAYVASQDGEKLYGRSATLLYTGTLDGEGYPEFLLK